MNPTNKITNPIRRAFTLIEILIVVVILGILAAIVVPQFTDAADDANDAAVRSQLQTLRGQIELYYAQNGEYPNLIADGWDDMIDNDYLMGAPTNSLQNSSTVAAAAADGDADDDAAAVHAAADDAAADDDDGRRRRRRGGGAGARRGGGADAGDAGDEQARRLGGVGGEPRLALGADAGAVPREVEGRATARARSRYGECKIAARERKIAELVHSLASRREPRRGGRERIAARWPPSP